MTQDNGGFNFGILRELLNALDKYFYGGKEPEVLEQVQELLEQLRGEALKVSGDDSLN